MPTRLIEFDAAADGHLVLAGHHLRRGEIHRVEARGAEAVDLHARHLSPKPATSAAARAMSPPASPTGSTQPSTTSSTSAGSSLLRSLIAAERLRREIERGDLVQRAVGLAAAARGADVRRR